MGAQYQKVVPARGGPICPPYSGSKYNRGKALREHVLVACGKHDVAPVEVVEAVLAALTTEEMEAVDALMREKREKKELAEAPWTAWAAIGRATTQVLTQNVDMHKRLLAKVVQKPGMSRAMARGKLGVSVGRRMWKHVKYNSTKQTNDTPPVEAP